MDKAHNRKKMENILREPLTHARLYLNSILRNAEEGEHATPFTIDDLTTFMASIKNQPPEYKKEVANILTALETGTAPTPPSFATPAMQLSWGAALAYLSLNPDIMKTWEKPQEDGDIGKSTLWKQLTGTRHAHSELLSHAHHVQEALRDKNTLYAWGEPGTGFTFERKKNLINIDFMQSLIVGFEHARADVIREIGLSQLSVTYPKRMQEVYREMAPLMRKSQLAQSKKGPKLKPDEYKQLRMLSAEWQLRHMLFSAAEENASNRFTANTGQQTLQDYSVSLNHTAVTFRGVGLSRLPAEDDVSSELRRYLNLCNTVQLSFFANNQLFDNTNAAWKQMGVETDLVRKSATLNQRAPDAQHDGQGIDHADFKLLRELCGGPKGLENLQPKMHFRLYGKDAVTAHVKQADAERKTIIETIWNLYAEDLIQQILKETHEQIDEQMKQKQQQQGQQGQDGDSDDQDNDDGQEGDEQDGDPQEGGKPQKGKKQKDKKKQKSKPQGEPQDGDEQDSDDQDGDGKQQKQSKKQQDKKDKKQKDEGQPEEGEEDADANADEQNGDEQDGSEQDADSKEDGQDDENDSGAEGDLGADKDETVPVEGLGDMLAPEGAHEEPGDEQEPEGKNADGEGNDADGDENDADGDGSEGDDQDGDGDDAANDNDAEEGDGQTAEELEKALKKMDEADEQAEAEQKAAQAGDKSENAGQKSKQKGDGDKKAGHDNGKPLADLAKQDWTNYSDRVAELAPVIARVRKMFKDVQERQLQIKRAQSRTLDILPENGEVMDRFNIEAHRNLILKKTAGQLEESDLNRFHLDENKYTPTEVDIFIFIDGSGSMNSGGKPTPLDSALQAGAIMFEAAAGKDMKMNVYVGLWGSDNPPVIIQPGDDRIKIGQSMEAAKKGLNSGTDCAPAIPKVADTIANQRSSGGTLSGFTHVLIISDGDIFDAEKTKKNIATMFDHVDKVTFDAAIITAEKGTAMQKMAESIKGRKPHQDFGIALGKNPNDVPMAIVGLVLDKVRKCGSFIAVPNQQKKREMRNAKNKMDQKNDKKR